MAKAVLTHRFGSGYDDRPDKRYHFPKTYLNQINSAVGDWIVYYEPRREGGRKAYYAAAKVTHVEKDPRKEDHFYALIDEFIGFVSPVPFQVGDKYYESMLVKDDGSTNKGAFGRSVRLIPDDEFDAILRAGLDLTGSYLPREEETPLSGLSEPITLFERPFVEKLTNIRFRDKAFSEIVRRAYDNVCAISGLKLVNGGGRPEVQGAHIIPVEENGPDTVWNGLALSGTLHWMFDRGLVSVADDHTILISHNKVDSETASRLIRNKAKLHLPKQPRDHPHPACLAWHRENRFGSELTQV